MHRANQLLPIIRRINSSRLINNLPHQTCLPAVTFSRSFYRGRNDPFAEVEKLMRDTEQIFKKQLDNFFREVR